MYSLKTCYFMKKRVHTDEQGIQYNGRLQARPALYGGSPIQTGADQEVRAKYMGVLCLWGTTEHGIKIGLNQ